MGHSNDWAQDYLVTPLTAPEPVDETGPGTHFRSTFQPAPSNDSTASLQSSAVRDLEREFTGSSNGGSPRHSHNPFRRSSGRSSSNEIRTTSVNMKPTYQGNNAYLSPPTSGDPRMTGFDDSHLMATSERPSLAKQRSHSHTGLPRPAGPSSLQAGPQSRRRGETTAGLSERPLQSVRYDTKRAHRSPHLKKQHQPPADLIDKLDDSSEIPYHHGGPFDATLASRNINIKNSPLDAVRSSNEEALRAVPREQVLDSLRRHQPLTGVAAIPPGEVDSFGRRMDYQEGENLMTQGENGYKRWPGVKYLPEDYKGKGEPSFSQDRAEKERRMSRSPGFDERGIPLETRGVGTGVDYDHGKAGEEVSVTPRSTSTGRHPIGEGLKRKLGSFRRKAD